MIEMLAPHYTLIKALHIIFMVTWFAGLFYLPRIFVYHAMGQADETVSTFKVMERKLMIMTHIGGSLTLIFGLLLLMINSNLLSQPWFHAKLTLLILLGVYHFLCRYYTLQFAADKNRHSHKFYRYFNEAPSLLLVAIVLLVIIKPQFGG